MSDGQLEAKAVEAGYGDVDVLKKVDLDAVRGRITGLIGPNGSGKSTLLKACAKSIPTTSGSVVLGGADIAGLSTREIARRMALLPQSPTTPPYLTVRELVEQGRYAHVGPLGMLRRRDFEQVRRAIELVRLEDFIDRDVDTLSGGERQRAWLALALAQDTPLLALDEPTTYLDIGHQFEALELIRSLNREQDVTVIMVLHDLNQAARFCDHLVMLDAGQVVASGGPWEALTVELLRRHFGIETSIMPDPETDHPVILPRSSTARTSPSTDGTAADGTVTDGATTDGMAAGDTERSARDGDDDGGDDGVGDEKSAADGSPV
ncbi:MAG: ABC transporter ATP-binding protein [Actinomycetota bacterium]